MLCVILAVIALLPPLVVLAVRSTFLQRWATSQLDQLIRSKGIVAEYDVVPRLWPLSIELRGVRVESNDGGEPLLVAQRVAVRPKFFGLLSGKLAIEQVDIDGPKVRVVLKDGKLANLGLELPKSDPNKPSGPLHVPSGSFAITDGELDLDIEGVKLKTQGFDVDVTSDDDPQEGATLEIALRMGKAHVSRTRVISPQMTAHDEDTLCLIDGRVRVDPRAIAVHRLQILGAADLDPGAGSAPPCKLPDEDPRNVELALTHTTVRLPTKPGDLPHVEGHVTARTPLAIGAKAGPFPETDGWISVDADVRYLEGMSFPDVNGKIRGHRLRIEKYQLASELESEIAVTKGAITSPRTTIGIADGVATLTNVQVEPLVKGIPLHATVDVKDASFTTLMRELGVSQHPHVTWDLKEVKVPHFGGTIEPLRLDGDMTAHTPNLAVFDKAVDDPARQRAIGVKEAQLAAHIAVRPDALQFKAIRATLPKSTIEGGFASIGFHEDLVVDVPQAIVDLSEISPLGSIPISGKAQASVKMNGLFGDPRLEADTSIEDFVLSGIPFGHVTAGHATLRGLTVELTGVKATKNKSSYEMPSGKLDFGGAANMLMDAVVASNGFAVRDFFNLFQMDEDPRFAEIDGIFTTNSTLHVALGGPQDRCKGGYLDIAGHAHMRDVKLFGEAFDDGDLDLNYEWIDRLAGLNGARIDVHAATLRKVRPKPDGIAVGTVFGSAKVDHGNLNGSVVVQGIPLSRVQSLGSAGAEIDGSVSGFAQVSGTIDAYKVQGNMDITPLLVRGTRLAGSHVDVAMIQQEPELKKSIGKTACGAPMYPEFDKATYDPGAFAGEYRVSGDLFGGQLKASDFVMTREKNALITGKLAAKKLDLGALLRVAKPPVATDDVEAAAQPQPLEGELSGELTIARVRQNDLAHAELSFVPESMTLGRAGQKVTMRPTSSVVYVKDNTIGVPPLTFDLQAGKGLRGTITVRGAARKWSTAPELAFNAELMPIDLGVLVGAVPKLERAQGTLGGSLYVTGKASAPEMNGVLSVRGGEFIVDGLPGPITAVELDVQADSSEVRISRGSAKFAGGTVAVTGHLPISGFTVGAGEVNLRGRNLRLAPWDGIATTLDADLLLQVAAPSTRADAKAPLPQIVGDVLLTSGEYTRPISLTTDLSALGMRAKRTVVESYDPSLDAVNLDIQVKNRGPLRIHNNLAEVELNIDPAGLRVTGTNQRMGLRGEVRAQQGGRVRFRSTEFEVRQAVVRFDDPTRIDPNIDVVATTEYRRYGSSSAAAGGAGGRTAGLWRITLHAYGDTDNLRLDLTSDPPLSQEDIVLLLTVGMTRTEVDQLQQSGGAALGAGVALEALSTATGADRAVTSAIPVIDDFRFGSGYSSRSGRTEPQVTIGKRITDDIRASVTTGLSEDRELRSNIEWRLSQRTSVLGSYDNVNDVSSSNIGNLGLDLRWRLEFQ
ncbi:translocation/assembly module TamB domain-containing protein [Pendulispora albinea]|uniref:Translocation/assembly module TamB domain-containing protein n=1 Tax=Pendulispora albinea TaxID=2741071 RepID=A0ABZ2LZL0_9BACT